MIEILLIDFVKISPINQIESYLKSSGTMYVCHIVQNRRYKKYVTLTDTNSPFFVVTLLLNQIDNQSVVILDWRLAVMVIKLM